MQFCRAEIDMTGSWLCCCLTPAKTNQVLTDLHHKNGSIPLSKYSRGYFTFSEKIVV